MNKILAMIEKLSAITVIVFGVNPAFVRILAKGSNLAWNFRRRFETTEESPLERIY